jgi:branched-chain amino acid transport system substrate-binding protein
MRRTNRVGWFTLAGLLAAAVAVAVVAGSAAGSAGGRTQAAAAAATCGLKNGKKASGAPIKIGAVATETGGIDWSSAVKAAKAYFDCVNDNGGINGRPIQYFVEDDKLNPETAGAAGAKLVNDVGVVAMVASMSYFDCSVNGKLYIQKNVLSLAGPTPLRACFENPNINGASLGPRQDTIGIEQFLHDKFHVKRIGFVSHTIPGLGDWSLQGAQAFAKANGMTVVKSILVPPVIQDPTSAVLDLVSAKPDAVIITASTPTTLAILKAVEQQNAKGSIRWTCDVPCVYPGLPQQLGSYWQDGSLLFHTGQVGLDGKGPDNLLWLAVMAKYAPKEVHDGFSQMGFVAAKFAVATLLKLDPAKIDRASVSKAFRAINGLRTDMLCDPFYWGPGKVHNPVHSGYIYTIKGADYARVRGCAETRDPALAGIYALERKLGLRK